MTDEEQLPAGLNNALHLAYEYMQDFGIKIDNCQSLEEYYELVTAVVIFYKSLMAEFKELYSMDSSSGDKMLAEINAAAESIVDNIASTVAMQRRKEMN